MAFKLRSVDQLSRSNVKQEMTCVPTQVIHSVFEGILRNQIFFSVLFSNQRLIYIWLNLNYISLYIDYPVERCKITVILFGSMLPNL